MDKVVILFVWLTNSIHGPLAERFMHMEHLSGNASAVLKSSSDWLKSTGKLQQSKPSVVYLKVLVIS